jgi:hypothetical protein
MTQFLCTCGKNRHLTDGLHRLAATVRVPPGLYIIQVDPLHHQVSFYQIPSLLKGEILHCKVCSTLPQAQTDRTLSSTCLRCSTTVLFLGLYLSSTTPIAVTPNAPALLIPRAVPENNFCEALDVVWVRRECIPGVQLTTWRDVCEGGLQIYSSCSASTLCEDTYSRWIGRDYSMRSSRKRRRDLAKINKRILKLGLVEKNPR